MSKEDFRQLNMVGL